MRSLVPCAILLAVAPAFDGCERPPRTAHPAPEAPATSVTALVPITNMLLVRAGSFTQLNRKVTLPRDYWIARYEVTQAEFAALTGRNPSYFAGRSNHPVEKVTYIDAVAYCDALTRRERERGHLPPGYQYRLPSEAEWEYACRAGSTNRFSFGDDPEAADAHAWTEENSDGTTHPVGEKLPNAWGLHDMHGNVWEWCLDWFEEFAPGEVTDPRGPPTGKYRIFRGGSWNHAAKFAGAANRFGMAPSNAIYFVGFRVVLAQDP